MVQGFNRLAHFMQEEGALPGNEKNSVRKKSRHYVTLCMREKAVCILTATVEGGVGILPTKRQSCSGVSTPPNGGSVAKRQEVGESWKCK